jgi:hypothetical protein
VGAGGTAILVEDSVAATGRSEPPAPRLFQPEADPGGVSLEDSILGVWEDLVGNGKAECPVCGGRMRITAGCEGCGSEMS